MTEKELKKLNRQELLEMLIYQIKKNERLQKRLDNAEQQLRDRNIAIEESGSLAEAALKLNNVFEAAQSAADQYLENIKLKYEQPKQSEDTNVQQPIENEPNNQNTEEFKDADTQEYSYVKVRYIDKNKC